ncbi:MAG: hypothetical protein HC897_09515, partial [Thermoanaerobaculia bacterium]|nr:hypothetical protein [Thermoanaerobaculia bacterium]
WGGHTYGYDAFNMQTTHDFPDWVQLYTADDERIVSLRYTGTSPIEETYTLRDLGGKALTSYKAIGGNTGTWYWEKDYVYRDGLLLAAESSEPWPKNQQHYVVDHLGTPRLVTGSNGSVVAIHHYFGFGEEIGGGSDPERLRFTGHERDFHEAGTEDDLDYMHARYCSPQLARFMSVDRYEIQRLQFGNAEERDRFLEYLMEPQSWNRYGYVRGNPLRFVDPDGETATAVLAAPGFLAESGATASGGAVLGTGAAVLGAGVLGYGVGTLVRQIPGVDSTIQDGLGVIVDSILLAQNTRHNLNIVAGNIKQASLHLDKIAAAGGPGKDPDFDHHRKEIKAFLKRAQRVADRLPGKLRDIYLKKIEEIASHAGLKV